MQHHWLHLRLAKNSAPVSRQANVHIALTAYIAALTRLNFISAHSVRSKVTENRTAGSRTRGPAKEVKTGALNFPGCAAVVVLAVAAAAEGVLAVASHSTRAAAVAMVVTGRALGDYPRVWAMR